MNITEEIIEAGAQAMCAIRFPRVHWSKLPAVQQVMAIDEARACLTGALAAAEPHNVVLAAVPEKLVSHPYLLMYDDEAINSFNACRAAFLAGKVVI